MPPRPWQSQSCAGTPPERMLAEYYNLTDTVYPGSEREVACAAGFFEYQRHRVTARFQSQVAHGYGHHTRDRSPRNTDRATPNTQSHDCEEHNPLTGSDNAAPRDLPRTRRLWRQVPTLSGRARSRCSFSDRIGQDLDVEMTSNATSVMSTTRPAAIASRRRTVIRAVAPAEGSPVPAQASLPPSARRRFAAQAPPRQGP